MSMEFCYNSMVSLTSSSSVLEKKEQNDHCSVMAEKTQQWNLKYQIKDPIFHHVYV